MLEWIGEREPVKAHTNKKIYNVCGCVSVSEGIFLPLSNCTSHRSTSYNLKKKKILVVRIRGGNSSLSAFSFLCDCLFFFFSSLVACGVEKLELASDNECLLETRTNIYLSHLFPFHLYTLIFIFFFASLLFFFFHTYVWLPVGSILKTGLRILATGLLLTVNWTVQLNEKYK